MKPYPIACLALAAGMALACGGARERPKTAEPEPAGQTPPPLHARIDAFILVHCPYAASAVQALTALEQTLAPAIALRFHLIGVLDEEGEPDPALGDAEIEAARIVACVERSAAERLNAFLACFYQADAWRAAPPDWQGCAERAGVEVQAVSACAGSDLGRAALAEAYGRAMEARIDASPTLLVDGRLYMGERSEDALTAYVCHLAGTPETRPEACGPMAPPPAVEATLLFDSRCSPPERCDASDAVALMEILIPNLSLIRVDYASSQGKILYDRIRRAEPRLKHLPLLLFDDKLGESASATARLDLYLIRFDKGYLLALESDWDPESEICDNRVDDTGDGLTDCDDPGCRDTRACRDGRPRRVDLFFMSGCPFSAALLPVVDRVIDHFGRDRAAFDFNLQFIGGVENGELASLHGEDEVDEDLRMICAEALYPERYRFMEYVLCRAAQYDSPAWEPCVPRWMDKGRLQRCARGRQGRALLEASFALADRLGITGSPTWLLNNRLPMEGRTGRAILERFCEENPGEPCGRELGPDPDPTLSPEAGRCR